MRPGIRALVCAGLGLWAVGAAAREPATAADGWLFASAPAFEAAAAAFATGGSLRQIRAAATRGYAEGQRRTVPQVSGVFTNPSDRRWERR